MTASATRVGVFGGAFDPPHLAHVALARAALEQLQLDELIVFPTGDAWHKSNVLSPAEHRLAMARIAFGELPRTVIDDRETRRPGPTYTVDTLRELKAQMPQAELFLIIGEDQAVSLTRWREWQAIPALATICMAARASTDADAPRALPSEVELKLLRLPEMPESATEVRERVAAHEGIDHLVPPGVARYIDRHSLYRPA